MCFKTKTIVLIILLIELTEVLCRDMSESERAARAIFIQRLLNKQKNLEGRVKLLGGETKYEGK